ncbi:DUF4367 domain-containing protein [Bacillus infantis]|uniref:DUF4367 domain-containing protein n=1 Tax=Bacillus infantis TaxID=324767 RepID=UPI00215520FB|nr:DUF4367 domain-containing protein [Bacillus infantis]MCR6609325.1 DUF4367 domain-containing protein [Bacillus infantis]
MNKRGILILVVLLLAAAGGGWTYARGNMHEYDYTQETTQLKREKLPMEIKLPERMPFPDMKVWETYSDGVGQVDLTFMNKNKNTVELVIKKEEFEYEEGLKQEEVRIGDLEGRFIPDDDDKRILYWEDDGVHYQITYIPLLTPSEVSRTQMIKMAESFRYEQRRNCNRKWTQKWHTD